MVELNKNNIKGKIIMGEYRVEQSNIGDNRRIERITRVSLLQRGMSFCGVP